MARRVAIDVFRVDVSTMLNQGLDYTQVATETGDVQRCSEVVRAGVHLCTKLNEDLDERCVSFARSEMQWCETIGVGTINNFKHFVV